jgi:hypothetical protein
MERFKKRKSAFGIARIVVTRPLYCFIICQNPTTTIVAFDTNKKLKPGQRACYGF